MDNDGDGDDGVWAVAKVPSAGGEEVPMTCAVAAEPKR